MSVTACRSRCRRASRLQWSTSLWRATPTTQPTVSTGGSGRRTASTAAEETSRPSGPRPPPGCRSGGGGSRTPPGGRCRRPRAGRAGPGGRGRSHPYCRRSGPTSDGLCGTSCVGGPGRTGSPSDSTSKTLLRGGAAPRTPRRPPQSRQHRLDIDSLRAWGTAEERAAEDQQTGAQVVSR